MRIAVKSATDVGRKSVESLRIRRSRSLISYFHRKFTRMGDSKNRQTHLSYKWLHGSRDTNFLHGGVMGTTFQGRRSLKFAVLLMTVGLCACESVPVKKAFTELGTSSDSEYGAYNTRFMRSINATGLSAEEVVGSLTLDPDKWSATEQARRIFPLRADLPDAMAPRVTKGDTFIAVRHLGKQTPNVQGDALCQGDSNPANRVQIATLIAIRDGLNGAQYNISRWASLSAKQNVLSTVLTEMKKPDVKAGTEKSTQLLDTVKSLYPEEAADGVASIEQSLKVIAKEVVQLELEWGKFKTSISTAGIVITNWEREVAASGNANVADASVSSGGSRKVSGFLILGDPQISTLFIGRNFHQLMSTFKAGTAGSLAKLGSGITEQRTYMTQYQLRAKSLVFSESQQAALRMRFEADLQKIAKTFARVLPSTPLLGMSEVSAKIDGFYSAVTGVAESSVIDASSGRLCTRKLKIEDEDENEIKLWADTIPIVSIRLSVSDYLGK